MIERLKKTTHFIQSIKSCAPKIGIVLGSGLGPFVEEIKNAIIIPHNEIPYFIPTSVEGHEGRLILGEINGVSVVALQGRLHAYEGHSMDEIVYPIRTLATLGIESLILTNASCGINLDYNPGDLILIEDHINLTGKNPLIGPNDNMLGPRFPDLTHAYHPSLKNILREAAKEINYPLKGGVYGAVLGPTFETPAEIHMLRTIGADMVGMSTVHESIVANHLGLKVCGISCITNMAAGIIKDKKIDHKEVKEEADKIISLFSRLLSISIQKMNH